MRWILLLVMLIGTSAMAGDTFWRVIPDTLYSEEAKKVIEEVWPQLHEYKYMRGRWPETVDELIEGNFISIDSVTREHWKFEIDYREYPSFIKAEPIVRRDGDPKDMTRISRVYFEENSLEWEVARGQWHGPGVPDFKVHPPTFEQQMDMTKEVRAAIGLIDHWILTYYQERGLYPKTVRELEQKGYMELAPSVYVQWEINFIGDPPASIEAISTYLMPGGKDKRIDYDIVNKKFSGYGVKE